MRGPQEAIRRHTPVRVGGSELLAAFLDRAVRLEATRFNVLSPYVDDAVFADAAVQGAWRRLLTTAQTTIVVRTRRSADAVLRSVPAGAQTPRVLINRRLHAKVLVARRNDSAVALIGSQNLTGAALRTSEELGLLVDPAASPQHRELVLRLCDVAEGFARRAARSTAGDPARSDDIPSRPERRPVAAGVDACRSPPNRPSVR
jgi:phosphatidylserine/phosphatidylglycerophosphate/cardiolipin synthase-like enzyme